MNPTSFAIYTCLGAGLWSLVLTLMGYFIGGNEALIKENLPLITFSIIVGVVVLLVGYYLWNKRQTA